MAISLDWDASIPGSINLDLERLVSQGSSPLEPLTRTERFYQGGSFDDDEPGVEQYLLTTSGTSPWVTKAGVIALVPKEAETVKIVTFYPGLGDDVEELLAIWRVDAVDK